MYYPYNTSFLNWQKLPIVKDQQWPRRSYTVNDTHIIDISEFFGDVEDKEFSNAIDREYIDLVHNIIRGDEGFLRLWWIS